MQAIDPADRKLLLIAGVVFVVLLGAAAFFTVPSGQAGEVDASTYSSAPSGARAAFLLIEDLHFSERRWQAPLNDLPADLSGVVLIIAEPAESPDSREQAALDQFVRNGGRVLITGAMADDFLAGADLLPRSEAGPEASYGAARSDDFTRQAPTIVLQPEALWRRADAEHAVLYGNARDATVVSWRIGAGQVLWWAGPEPLTNSGIAREGNLNLFLDAVGAPLDGARRPAVWWDEYHHGERDSLWAYAQKTPLPWALAQTGLLLAAILFTFSRRAGPLVAAYNEPRLWPLEFVDTLGGLYERAGAVPAAVGVVYRNFRAALAHRFQLPLTASGAALAAAIEARVGPETPEASRALRLADDRGAMKRLKPAEGLAVIQEIETLGMKMGLKKPSSELEA